MFKGRNVAGLSLLAVIASWGQAQAQVAGVCFAPTDKPSVAVLENAPPPRVDGLASYPYYPASAVASMDLATLVSSRSTLHKYYWQWGNHGPRAVLKGNQAPGVVGDSRSVVVNFSSTDTADACTLAQTATVLGLSTSAVQSAALGQLTLTRTVPTAASTTDVCILPTQVIPRGVDVLLDYEVQDGRADAQALPFLARYAALDHASGRHVLLYTNPLDAPGQPKSGIDGADVIQIAQAYDGIDVLLWSGNRQGDIRASFASQIQMLGALRTKAYTVFELAGTSLTDAANVRKLMGASNIGTVLFWRNNAQQGGSCATDVNRKIACVAYGRCA